MRNVLVGAVALLGLLTQGVDHVRDMHKEPIVCTQDGQEDGTLVNCEDGVRLDFHDGNWYTR
jgi:hypothetical protein